MLDPDFFALREDAGDCRFSRFLCRPRSRIGFAARCPIPKHSRIGLSARFAP